MAKTSLTYEYSHLSTALVTKVLHNLHSWITPDIQRIFAPDNVNFDMNNSCSGVEIK
jgi:hypothetical protein